MKEYMAKQNTGIYPYSRISPGEILQPKHIEAMGDRGLADLLARGVIVEIDSAPEEPVEPDPAAGAEQNPEDGEIEDAAEPAGAFDEDDALEDLELPGLEDTVGDAEEPTEEPAPTAKKKTGRNRAK